MTDCLRVVKSILKCCNSQTVLSYSQWTLVDQHALHWPGLLKLRCRVWPNLTSTQKIEKQRWKQENDSKRGSWVGFNGLAVITILKWRTKSIESWSLSLGPVVRLLRTADVFRSLPCCQFWRRAGGKAPSSCTVGNGSLFLMFQDFKSNLKFKTMLTHSKSSTGIFLSGCVIYFGSNFISYRCLL